jgi:hypothetical protein
MHDKATLKLMKGQPDTYYDVCHTLQLAEHTPAQTVMSDTARICVGYATRNSH